jgi:hypothetical protein
MSTGRAWRRWMSGVDVRMPPTMTDDGLRAAVEARRRRSELGVLVLSAYMERSYADVLLSRWTCTSTRSAPSQQAGRCWTRGGRPAAGGPAG